MTLRNLNCFWIITSVCLLGFALSRPAWADIYQWVDETGVIHFSDQPPTQKDEGLQVVSMPSAPPSAYQPPPKEVKTDVENVAETTKSPPPKDEAVKPTKVELYVTSWCKYCKLARNYLLANNIPFNEYDIEKDSQAAKRRKALDKRPGVPLAVINNQVIIGFSKSSYSRALKAAR